MSHALTPAVFLLRPPACPEAPRQELTLRDLSETQDFMKRVVGVPGPAWLPSVKNPASPHSTESEQIQRACWLCATKCWVTGSTQHLEPDVGDPSTVLPAPPCHCRQNPMASIVFEPWSDIILLDLW